MAGIEDLAQPARDEGWHLAVVTAYAPGGSRGRLTAQATESMARGKVQLLLQAVTDAAHKLRGNLEALAGRANPIPAPEPARTPAQDGVGPITKLRGLSAAFLAWLGYEEPLRDEQMRRSLLHFVVVDLFHHSADEYAKVLAQLGLRPSR